MDYLAQESAIPTISAGYALSLLHRTQLQFDPLQSIINLFHRCDSINCSQYSQRPQAELQWILSALSFLLVAFGSALGRLTCIFEAVSMNHCGFKVSPLVAPIPCLPSNESVAWHYYDGWTH